MSSTIAEPLGDDWVRARPRITRRDVIIVALLLVGTALSLLLYSVAGFYEQPAPVWVSTVWVLVMGVPLLWRRRHPEIVALVASVAFLASQVLMIPELLFSNIWLFLAVYSVGAWSASRRRAMIVRLVIIVGMFAWLFTALIATSADPDGMGGFSRVGALSPFVAVGLIQIVTNLLYFGAAYVFGDAAWRSARAREELEVRTHELTAARGQAAAQAVTLERVRIARDLHDVVAHHVSVMGIQAGAARTVLATDPAQAAESLGAIEQNARSAVEELHHLLGTLRDPGATDTISTGASTHGIEQLPELVDEARSTGTPVQFATLGEVRTLPPTVGLSVYRVAQEALTNTLKHAGAGTPADVRVRYLDDAVEIEISDTGTGTGHAALTGAGLGHVGMRERVAALGGSIEIGPKPRGGYRVRARFPTREAAR